MSKTFTSGRLMERRKERYLEAGKIANTHGVRGDLVVDSLCDSPEVLKEIKTLYLKKQGEYIPMKVVRSSLHAGRNLIRFEGVETLDDALHYKGRRLYAAREDIKIDDDSVFIADLIGLPVYNRDSGEVIGRLSDVVNYGYNDILEIDIGDKKSVLVPNLPQFVERISLEDGIFVIPVEGLLN